MAAGPGERALVELVDRTGRRIGTATVAQAHVAPGQLHRAFSVLLLDRSGRLLLQRRSAAKSRFPLRWANTCCGHPAPGEPVVDAATRRLGEELGITGIGLDEIGIYQYQAVDPDTGAAEHEYDHVVFGHAPDGLPVRPDPTEVAALRWAGPDDLLTALATHPDAYAPWLAGVLRSLAAVGRAGWDR